MMKNVKWFGFLIALLMLATLACATVAAPTATAAPTNTPLPADTATATTPPTSTPRPTATPNIAATKEYEADQARLEGYVSSGYISSTKGTVYKLDDSMREMAKRNYLDYDFTGYDGTIKDFAAWADLKSQSAGPVAYPEYSGCGFGFRMQENGDAYTAMVTNDRVLITWCLASLNHKCGIAGKTRGTGTVKLGNPAEVHFEFIVNGLHAFALVNKSFVAEYTLFDSRLIEPGWFTYSIISGTNKDYGTRCTITNGKLWVPTE